MVVAGLGYNTSNLLYLITIVTFILALRFLSSPAHARRGNQIGAAGMVVAIGVTFARSGLSVRWDPAYASLLELAEACSVPVRWSCRTGVCHNCESGLLSGAVTYAPDPVEPPAEGNVLICCSAPRDDIVLDL